MDEVERAQLETERFLTESLRKQVTNKADEVEATGFCLNCIEPFNEQADQIKIPRWCDKDCRDDWEKRELAP